MNREQLEHAIRAACEVAKETELWVFGSQCILGEHPEPPPALQFSMELDVDPKNRPESVDAIDGALGEDSQFHKLHGFYVHGVSIETAILPKGWQDRTIAVTNSNTKGKTGHCLEAHDLAASKLAANRDKDRKFVRTLLKERLVSPETLQVRVDQLSSDLEFKSALRNWIVRTSREMDQD